MKNAASSLKAVLTRLPGQTAAVALETVQQERGFSLWLVAALGGAAALWAGFGLSGGNGAGESLTAFCFYNAMSFLLFAWAMATGARGLAGDRASGLSDLVQSRPLAGTAYFLGRFAGLAARLSIAALLAAALGGLALLLLEGEKGYREVVQAERFVVEDRECPLGTPVLLSPGSGSAHWFFDGASLDQDLLEKGGAALRFTFRIRLPRGKPLQGDLPIRVAAQAGAETVLEKEISISLRNEFTLVLDPIGRSGRQLQDGMLHVSIALPGGQNFMELDGGGCSFIARETGPLAAIGMAMVSLLPVLWTALALGLFLSAVVGEAIALAATAVLSLVVLAGPALEGDFKLMAAGAGGGHCCSALQDDGAHAPPGQISRLGRTLASWAASAVARLPDPGAGGGSIPLSRGECPGAGAAAPPWREAAAPLLLFLCLGCLAVARRWA